ncbi:MAG: NIPSNAP family protein [Candidatus Hydrogenedentes bacterium]|nr:NIPSNAP family protein [Candidatus Hydrogenedentota bacterium]
MRHVRIPLIALLLAGIFAAGIFAGIRMQAVAAAPAAGERVYELRTYTTHEGRLDALHKRFTDHTCALFEKHGMTLVGFWTPTDGDAAKNTLVYIVSHESREKAAESWKAFSADPAWQKAKEDSEKDGKIVEKAESVYMAATDYSPIK